MSDWPNPGSNEAPSSKYDPVAFGILAEKVNALRDGQAEIKTDVKTILGYIERQKGAKWAFGTIVGTASALIVTAVHRLFP